MDKRKIIGTIIGVIMFAALIVGATYAWLSFNATVTNATANGTTLNYWVNYTKGNDLSDLPILSAPTKTNASLITVKAQKPKGSVAKDIKLKIKATTTGLTTTSGVIKCVVCQGGCSNSDLTTYTVQSVAININASTEDDDSIVIYTGTLPGEWPADNNSEVQYDIYMWIDAATLTNNHLTNGNNEFSGYVWAESVQSAYANNT